MTGSVLLATSIVECYVYGLPAPQGSKKVFNGHVVESSAKVKPWREAVVAQVREVLDGQGAMLGATVLSATFYMPRPKAHYRADGSLKDSAPIYHTSRPDADKLLRSTMDGLGSAGTYLDDSQVCVLQVEKRYVDIDNPTPGASLSVELVYANPHRVIL